MREMTNREEVAARGALKRYATQDPKQKRGAELSIISKGPVEGRRGRMEYEGGGMLGQELQGNQVSKTHQ